MTIEEELKHVRAESRSPQAQSMKAMSQEEQAALERGLERGYFVREAGMSKTAYLRYFSRCIEGEVPCVQIARYKHHAYVIFDLSPLPGEPRFAETEEMGQALRRMVARFGAKGEVVGCICSCGFPMGTPNRWRLPFWPCGSRATQAMVAAEEKELSEPALPRARHRLAGKELTPLGAMLLS